MTTPDFTFTVEGAEALAFAASPQIAFKLRVVSDSPQPIHSIILRCQIQIDAARRTYSAAERARLTDLFGQPAQWGETLRSMLWTSLTVVVPSFESSTVTDLPVPCTFDFNIGATKYFAAIDDGELPVSFYFNGSVFYAGDDAGLQVAQISWEKEASYRMPAGVWRQMMDLYYPNSAWLCLRRDVFDLLCAYKVRHGIPTFEETLLQMLETKVEARTA
ncbi:MAG TPA: DUF6084 family protein [Terriglobia bacterium]|jgi:hypothetical protein